MNRQEVPSETSAMRKPFIAAAVVIGLAWINFGLYQFAHFDLMNNPHSVSETDSLRVTMYLGLAIAAIVIGLPGAYAVGRSQTKLVREGLKVAGSVCGVASVSFKGLRDVVAEYSVAGQRYETSASRNTSFDDQVGDEITVYVDRSNPKKVYVDWTRKQTVRR